MAVKEHQVFIELLENVKSWALPDIENHIKRGDLAALFGRVGVKLSPEQQYEYNSYYWCSRLVSIFDRLEWIRAMTSRSLHKRKNEKKCVLLEEWIMYNYEHYTVVYQAILDVALLLTNEVFRLGNPYKKCSYSTVCDNTRINGTSIHRILEKLRETTDKHREGKNLLVHRGEWVELPLQTSTFYRIDVINTAIKLGIEVNDSTQELLSEFLAVYGRKDLIRIMEKECTEIESQVEELFSALLPHYRRFRSASF